MSRLSGVARAAQQEDALDVDYSERAGFLTGKSAAMADWAHRKEDREYNALFARLYARNHARLRRERDPEGVRSALNAWRASNREHVNDLDRARKRAARTRELKALGATFRVVDGVAVRVYRIVCPVCLSEPEMLQPNAKFCSKTCANRWHGVPRARARNRGLRNMSLAATAMTHLEIEPGLTLGELHARMRTTKYGSLATWLCHAAKAGKVLRHGRKYSLAKERAA